MAAAPPGDLALAAASGAEGAELWAGDGGLVRLAVEAPAVGIERLIPLVEGPRMVWRSPEPEPDGRVWSIVGWGEAARVDASGPGMFGEVRRFAARLFGSMLDRPAGAVNGSRGGLAPALTPRLFGGVAFPSRARLADRAAGAGGGPPWESFAEASFSMPRRLYAVSGDRAWLEVVVRGDQVDEGSRELAAMRLAVEALAARAREGEPGGWLDARAGLGDARGGSADDERASMSPEVWRSMVLDALARIRAGELTKIVPAAVRRVTLAEPPALEAVIERLSAAYPECHVFALERGASTFVGASPERLVIERGLHVEADALAGSIRRGSGGDELAKERLLSSEKDRREHALVVDAIRSALGPRCASLHVPAAPVVRSLRNVHHLHTPISGELSRAGHVLDLVELLHPTPAVCGAPREAALAWISAREPAPRGFYAGALGWFDDAGDGAFSVAIRSALLAGREAWIYAGAGVVEGSDPDAELAETRVKQAPMLAALGVRAS